MPPYYDDPFASHRAQEAQRHRDTMAVLTSFIEKGIAGTLELDMDRYGHVRCKIDLTGKPGSTVKVMPLKSTEDILALRARLDE
jgi:hypothetical protein